MDENTTAPQTSPETSQRVNQAYDRGIDHPYDQDYGKEARSATLANAGTGVSSADISEIVDQLMNDTPPDQIRTSDVRNLSEQLAALEVDEKLAVFYFIYLAMGDSVTPAALGSANVDMTSNFFNEFNRLPFGDAQLEAQRALVRGDDTPLSQAYGSQTENNKLAIWYLIAERMGKDIIGLPEDYKASDNTNQALGAVKQLDFGQQITFLRDFASCMGKAPVETPISSHATQPG